MPFLVENLRALLRILVFRASPAELSASRNLLILLIAGSVGIGYLAAGILPQPGPVELQLLAAMIVTLGLVYLALYWRGLLRASTRPPVRCSAPTCCSVCPCC